MQDHIDTHLSTFEQQDCNLAEIEIDKMLRFVRNIASKISSNNDVPKKAWNEGIVRYLHRMLQLEMALRSLPSGVVLFVELFLDIGGYILCRVHNREDKRL